MRQVVATVNPSHPSSEISVDVYLAKALGNKKNRPGTWDSLRVGVFRVVDGREEQVGEYVRNHPGLYDTFHPFTAGDRTLALYSPDYTTTRVMELPSCRDLGGEERSEDGFCPVDFFVPAYVVREWTDGDGEVVRERVNDPAPDDTVPGTIATSRFDPATRQWITGEAPTRIVTPLAHYPFGFVAGCIWADDRSWKIQYLDLSEAAEGRIRREERFGYVELPHGMRLRDAVDLTGYLYDGRSTTIGLTIQRRYRLDTGEAIDPWE